MGNYTSFLEDVTYDIFEEEDYVEELKKAAELFRTFDKALDSFIVNYGYTASLTFKFDSTVHQIISSNANKSVKANEKGLPISRALEQLFFISHNLLPVFRKAHFL